MEQAMIPAPSQAVARFAPYHKLTVRQRKRWIEILFSLEMKNAYDVYDQEQMPVLRVQEQGRGVGSFLKRIFLGTSRWFTAHVTDLATQSLLLEIKRPFRFIFHRIEIADSNGTKIGAVQRRWSWIRRLYDIEDASGQVVMTLFGPFWRPWTFQFRLPGTETNLGMLQKRWSGLGKEMFTDADNFGIELAQITDPTLKTLLFSATVLIDVVHFERSKG
jgi:uncharacterized protein YxjI